MHRRTRTAVGLAACGTFVLLAASGCDGDPPPPGPCERSSRQTIVFYDQSASSVADAPTLELFREAMDDLLESGLECRGDAVRGFLVHEHTRGKVGRVEVVNSVDPPDTFDVPSLDKAKEVTRYAGETKRLRDEGERELASLLTASVPPEFRDHTDLLGTLEVISDAVEKADSGSVVRVVYLGDMHESMPAPRRDFDARPPASRAEAEAWADADTAVLRELGVDRARFGRVEVRVLLGNLATRPGAVEIRRYWERLFANAGIRAVEYN